MIIDPVEGRPEQQAGLAEALKGRTVLSSELARLECRIGALRAAQTAYLETYGQFFDRCDLVPLDRPVFDLAAVLRVRHGIKTPDTIHLAAAINSGCGELSTNDKRLAAAAVSPIRILTWDDLDPWETAGGPLPAIQPPNAEASE